MRTFQKGEYQCNEMTAYAALMFLPKVLSLFPDDELLIVASINEQSKEFVKEYLYQKDVLSDSKFVEEMFVKTNLLFQGERLQEEAEINSHFEDIFDLFEIISWVLEVTYLEALSRKLLEIPKTNPVSRANKIISTELAKKRSESNPKKYDAQGVPPPNMNPWLFSVIASSDKNKRCDWELLHRFKTDFNLVDFMEIWETLESVKTYEAAELINSL